MGVSSRVALSHLNLSVRDGVEANACTIYMTYHTGGLGYANTNGISTRLDPVRDCNIRETTFSDERKHA